MADSVDKAFEDLLVLNLCLKRIHWFSSGVSGKEMRSVGDRCASCSHWSLILNGFVEKSTVTMKSLFDACRVGRVDAIRSIVTHYEVDVNSVDKINWTALHFAALHNQKEAVNCLQALGAKDVLTNDGILPSDIRPELFGKKPVLYQVPDNIKDAVHDLSSLLTSLQKIFLGTCKTSLIARMVRVIDKFGKEVFYTKFHDDDDAIDDSMFILKGVKHNVVWLCRMFLELGGDVNTQFSNGWTVLHEACQNDNMDCMCFLLDAGANVNAQNDMGSTALHVVCDDGNDECLRHLLLVADVDVNIRDSFGQTALHAACQIDSIACIQLLLEAGADVDIKEDNGRNALDVAHWRGNIAIMRLLDQEKEIEPAAKRQRRA